VQPNLLDRDEQVPRRDGVLTTLAILFGLLAISNFLKPLQLGQETGFVFLGQRQSGMANTILGPLFGAYLAVYAAAIWRRKRYAVPMAWVYAAYVMLNLILFTVRGEAPPGVGYMVFGIVYAVIAIGVSLGAAILLTRRRSALT
jgi:hypothetical protein